MISLPLLEAEVLVAITATITAITGYFLGMKKRKAEVHHLSVDASNTAVATLMEALGTLREELDDLQEEVSKLTRTNRELRKENEALRLAVANLKALLYGDRTRLDDTIPAWDLLGTEGPKDGEEE